MLIFTFAFVLTKKENDQINEESSYHNFYSEEDLSASKRLISILEEFHYVKEVTLSEETDQIIVYLDVEDEVDLDELERIEQLVENFYSAYSKPAHIEYIN